MKKRQKSPCIAVCEFGGPKGWCLGCGRTRDELKTWKAMKPFAKTKLENELKRRMTKIATAKNEE